jgi:hypothetical protein
VSRLRCGGPGWEANLCGDNRVMDMEMMICYNAVERDLSGWKALFAKADRRLTLESVITPPGSAQSIMSLVLKEGNGRDRTK